ncbi:DUF6065 family protein [Xanthomonas sp. SS]|uniref:DUF6065 family protein n=1 Tax=Xanthomonas sp. SS TaxID=2724122 RepID=UPI0021083576|nr:DUF6065 family protein [Xanthomonas sp. SS]
MRPPLPATATDACRPAGPCPGGFAFTLNWQFTRRGRVRFDAGEPLCHFFKVQRRVLAETQPRWRGRRTTSRPAAMPERIPDLGCGTHPSACAATQLSTTCAGSIG